MSEFTENDRKFIRKIAKMCDSHEKRIKSIEDDIEAAMSGSDTAPITDLQKKFGDESTIQFKFKSPDANVAQQQVLIESIYQTLRDMCIKHNIAKMEIFINASQ